LAAAGIVLALSDRGWALEGPGTSQPAPGVRQTGSNTFAIGQVQMDSRARTLTLPARINMQQGIIEYALVSRWGKTHESLLVTDAHPQQVHLACLLLGLTACDVTGEPNQPQVVPASNRVHIELCWEEGGKEAVRPLWQTIALQRTGAASTEPMEIAGPWLYNGSRIDPSGFAAQEEGSLISLIRDPSALVNNPRADRDDDTLHVPNTALLPARGAPVRVVFRFQQTPSGKGATPASPPRTLKP